MIVKIEYGNGSQYDLNLYRVLDYWNKKKVIDTVYVTDTHAVVIFQGDCSSQAWHLNRLSGRLLTSIGKPIKVEPKGYGIRWVKDVTNGWPCFKVI